MSFMSAPGSRLYQPRTPRAFRGRGRPRSRPAASSRMPRRGFPKPDKWAGPLRAHIATETRRRNCPPRRPGPRIQSLRPGSQIARARVAPRAPASPIFTTSSGTCFASSSIADSTSGFGLPSALRAHSAGTRLRSAKPPSGRPAKCHPGHRSYPARWSVRPP